MANVWLQHRSSIAGVWELTSFDIWDRNGSGRKLLSQPNGVEPLGRSVITPGGFSSAHNVNPQTLRQYSQVSLSEATDAQLAEILRAVSHYCGQVQLFEESDGTLRLEITVEAASDPQRLGSIQKRNLVYSNADGQTTMLLKPVGDFYLKACLFDPTLPEYC
ncbi:uncharacterized protein N7496_001524 [Penicillium cataractarum]|uniref:Lipocalin-like domain-containing protein n=1 Tax=Penicillium cataractarum TaxID=2100454 RepID=A0A9X0B704_9EURO|nr:uncharacterized protein N7496_001524 [Penicillium cataractarum]KAJ5390456.1 hypothetical protein N7496_001524 [Penicillium cataractarum]